MSTQVHVFICVLLVINCEGVVVVLYKRAYKTGTGAGIAAGKVLQAFWRSLTEALKGYNFQLCNV